MPWCTHCTCLAHQSATFLGYGSTTDLMSSLRAPLLQFAAVCCLKALALLTLGYFQLSGTDGRAPRTLEATGSDKRVTRCGKPSTNFPLSRINGESRNHRADLILADSCCQIA
eukprot:2196506-Amphidinium_carterae.1